MGAIAKYYRITDGREPGAVLSSVEPSAWESPTGTANPPTPQTDKERESGLIEQFKQGLELAEKASFDLRWNKRKHNGNIRLALARSVIQEPKPLRADGETWERDKKRLERVCKADGAGWGDDETRALARMFGTLGGNPRQYKKQRAI